MHVQLLAMVARTPPVNSLKKGFLPQIHHPLPLNYRESQQLLNSITTSFRKHLDKAHPLQPQDASSSVSRASRLQTAVLNPKEALHEQRPTDLHLNTILSNPLFARPKRINERSLQASTATERANAEDVQAFVEKSMYIFESAVAKGLMTPERAAGFLASIAQKINAQPALALEKRCLLGDTGAGLKVVQWLRASGQDHSLEFLDRTVLINRLAPFLFAEKLEEVMWNWLARLGAHIAASPADEAKRVALSNLMDQISLVRDKDGLTVPLDEKLTSFLRMNETLPLENSAIERSIRTNWARLSWASTVDAWKWPKPSAPLFERFINVGRPWNKPLDIAHLELHHPTSPDHSSAVQYLHDDTRMQAIAERVKSSTSDRLPRRVVSLGNDTIDRLKFLGQIDEASWVSEFLSRTFFGWNMLSSKERGFVKQA